MRRLAAQKQDDRRDVLESIALESIAEIIPARVVRFKHLGFFGVFGQVRDCSWAQAAGHTTFTRISYRFGSRASTPRGIDVLVFPYCDSLYITSVNRGKVRLKDRVLVRLS